jgi:hypothetical protein
MIIKRQYGLAGKFKFDVYTKDNKLKYTTDYFDNFITSTGLEYAKTYGFADCFRYISLGSGTTQNSITSNGGKGTTGLAIAVPRFQYIGGNLEDCSCSDGNTLNQYVSKGCGYRIENTGVVLNRAWRIPSNQLVEGVETDAYFTEQYTFKEYMLSPGRTGITGYVAFDDLTPAIACSCNEGVYEPLSNTTRYGKEAPDFYAKFPNACNTPQAFSRVIKDLSVDVNEYLVVSYALTINLSNATGIRFFDVTADNSKAVGVTYNWNRVTGATSLVVPGVKLINNGDVSTVNFVNQIDSHVFRLGESFVPPMGIAMEPSCPEDNLQIYLSNDNLQFRINESGGPVDVSSTSPYRPFNPAGRVFPSGLILFHKDYIEDTSDLTNDVSNLGGNSQQKQYFYRPRTDYWKDTNGAYAQQSDFSQPAIASDLTDSTQDPISLLYTFTPTYFTPISTINGKFITPGSFSDRSRSRTITCQFAAPELTPPGIPIRSMVYAYMYQEGPESSTWFATIDALFAPKKGSLAPGVDTTNYKYNSPDDIIKDANPSSSGHYYMDPSNLLQVIYKLTWTSDCPNTVQGC